MNPFKPTLTAFALMAASASVPVMAGTEQSMAPTSINNQIEVLIQKAATANKVPAISVSVTRHGQAIWNGAEGVADISRGMAMTADTRSRIGSVSKALVTGPAGFRMLEAGHVEPSQKLLYGVDGILGQHYDNYIQSGVSRYSPIAEIDISSTDKVYTWYQNGTVSIGASTDLGMTEQPKPFSMPTGWAPIDIRGMAISKNDTVYTWVDDASQNTTDSPNLYVYKGTSTDLDAYMDSGDIGDIGTNKAPKVKIPGHTAYDIVGIAIRKSDDHVFVWYNDGTVSSGTSTDFGKYAQPAPFAYASVGLGQPWQMRGIGIAQNDHVYAWFENGKATSGTPTNLQLYYKPYAYKVPRLANVPDLYAQYHQITVQDLLDHKAGFTRSGDSAGAAKMFNIPESEVTYRQIHEYFLLTRKLVYTPGTKSLYSNHGFGLWTLMIEAYSGVPYREYVEQNYLGPLGLSPDIVAQDGTLEDRDAAGYELGPNNTFIPIAVEASTTGLAAGGWRSSAKGLTHAMQWLTDHYSNECINEMGWSMGSKGNLSHNGSIGGGLGLVTILPTGFKSATKKNVGGIQIALLANRTTSGDTAGVQWIYDLRDQIADLLADVGPKTPPAQPPVLGVPGFKLACQTK